MRLLKCLVLLLPLATPSSAQSNSPDMVHQDGFETRTACTPAADGGSAVVAEPVLTASLYDSFHESWLASPAVVDLDNDGTVEILAARHGRMLGWHADGSLVFSADTPVRIWPSPVVADFVPGIAGKEVAVVSGDKIYLWTSSGIMMSGFPVTWSGELRSLAAGDIDGNGDLELVTVTTSPVTQNEATDVFIAYNHDGSIVAGFPPYASGASGCTADCYPFAGYGQNVALGNVDGDAALELLVSHDNPYLSLHKGTGLAFDANAIFQATTKFPGVRFLHDYSEAQQGYSLSEESSNQSFFTRSAPVIADIDGDGQGEVAVLGTVSNVAYTDRERGVALWVVKPDGSRPAAWHSPYHAAGYLAGLYDLGGNMVGAGQQLAAADIDPYRPGPEFLFADLDGHIHAVDSAANQLWQYTYTTDDKVLTSGVVVADLSGDGQPEIVFATYSPDADKSSLVILDSAGQLMRSVALPERGAMAIPTIADADADETLDIVVNLKDAVVGVRQVLVFEVPGSEGNCMPWPTGRGNLLRSGFLPPEGG